MIQFYYENCLGKDWRKSGILAIHFYYIIIFLPFVYICKMVLRWVCGYFHEMPNSRSLAKSGKGPIGKALRKAALDAVFFFQPSVRVSGTYDQKRKTFSFVGAENSLGK